MTHRHDTYWAIVARQFRRHPLGVAALVVAGLMALMGLYAPLLASSKPLMVVWDGQLYFPLFRYLFFQGFFSKRMDLFYNLSMFTVPLLIVSLALLKGRWRVAAAAAVAAAHIVLFLYVIWFPVADPASDPSLSLASQEAVQARQGMGLGDPLLRPLEPMTSWEQELSYMNNYARLNEVLAYRQRRQQHKRLERVGVGYAAYARERWLLREVAGLRAQKLAQGVTDIDAAALREEALVSADPAEIADATAMPTLWAVAAEHEDEQREGLQRQLAMLQGDYPAAREGLDELLGLCRAMQERLKSGVLDPSSDECRQLLSANEAERAKLAVRRQIVGQYEEARGELDLLDQRNAWLKAENDKITMLINPLVRTFHWEDDAGGDQNLNRYVPWNERTRINRKDLVAALIFGMRISLMVGVLAVGLALAIGVPIGALAGYHGGKLDIVVSRLIEIWESMPTFFMLLIVVAMTQSKSVFLVIGTIGIFGWTGFSRFLRGEFFKQRNLPYVEACHAMGFREGRIIFRHILPNAIPPLLTLLPFAIMGAITSEAGLSFLGLGEEDSCSWGVLMDEGRTAFPAESYLLWPPAIILTALLVAIALVGDALRDAIDPKMRGA